MIPQFRKLHRGAGLLGSLLALSAMADEPTLKERFAEDFHIGAALGTGLFRHELSSELAWVAARFSSITPENLLKWEPFHPEPGRYRFAAADRFVAFGTREDLYVVGHVLFWHNQTPDWVFQDAAGGPVPRERLLQRMRERVRVVAERYRGRIHAWDVVNETFHHDGSLRTSPWTRILGESFLEEAFRIAGDALPDDVALLYNDYSMDAPGKREAVVRMIGNLKRKGLRIDGVGMQGHWSVDHPSVEAIEASIVAFAEAGVKVHITELDIDVLPRKPGMWDAEVSRRLEQDPAMDPYTEGLPAAMQQRLADRYAELFRLFLKHRDKIERVTFWGTDDGSSWLNDWPIRGRTSHPLLFDREREPKPAHAAVLSLRAERPAP